MNTPSAWLLPVLAVMASAAPVPTTAAQDAARPVHELTAEGLRALEAGDYVAALEAFTRAAERDPDAPELAYNRGVAHYRLGDYERAADFFTRTLAPGRPGLEARARYNLGNCDYAEALQRRKTDPQTAIERLESALAHYAAALERAPNDHDARSNAERAQRLIDQLRAELQQQQDQQQSQQDEQQQPQNQQQEEEQQQQSDDQEQQDDRQQRDPSQPREEQQDEQQEGRQERGQQEEPNDRQQPDQRPQAQQPDPNRTDDAQHPEQDRQQPRKHEQEQQDAANQQPSTDGRQDSDRQQDAEPEPQDKPPAPSQQGLEGQDPDQNAPQQAGQPGEDQDADAEPDQMQPAEGEAEGQTLQARRLSREQAARLLQMIRDKERQRRLELARREQARQAPVRKDW